MADDFSLDAALREDSVLVKHLEDLRGMHHVQHSPGNWNYSPYMHGLAMGLELALAAMEGREPDTDAPQTPYLSQLQASESEVREMILTEPHTLIDLAFVYPPSDRPGAWRLSDREGV